ncbi:MAG TPA: glycosyltransferase family 4 protein [Gaiellaceae bacterium]|nr:glycosyltransferase family 4 protein [Gaiellaceae bacterium]
MAGLRGRSVVFVLAGEVSRAERGALDLAEVFRAEGASVGVLALDDRTGRARHIAADRGIPWTSVRVPWSGGHIGKGRSLLEVTRALRAMRPDAIIASTNLPNVVTGLTWPATGARTGVWRQCDVNGTTRFSSRVFRCALHATPVVVTSAEHGRAWLASGYGLDPSRVQVIPSPVRLPSVRESGAARRERLALADDAFVCCMVAHLHAGKDHVTLLRAWRTVVTRLNGLRPTLLVAGRDAGTEGATKALACDLDLRDSVRFVGEVNDVAGLLDACDLAVFCSQRELMPSGVAEPMAAALPVVATDLPGTREAFGEADAGVLVASGDPAVLADAILRLAHDADLRRRRGAANRAAVQGRSDPETAWVGLISDALEPRRS